MKKDIKNVIVTFSFIALVLGGAAVYTQNKSAIAAVVDTSTSQTVAVLKTTTATPSITSPRTYHSSRRSSAS